MAASRIENWKRQYTVSPLSLGVYRVVFCLAFLLLCYRPYSWLGEIPDAFFSPPQISFAALFVEFPPAKFFHGLDVLLLASLFLTMAGLFTRASTASLALCLLIGNSFQYSLGKIDHDIFVLCVLIVMIKNNWGQTLSIDRMLGIAREGSSNIATLAFLLGFGFFTAGFGKAINWIDFDPCTGGFLNWLHRGILFQERTDLLAPAAMNLRPLWIWEFADIMAVVFELGCIATIAYRRWLHRWLLVACAFHLMNCLLLNIPFVIHAVCYLVFVPWSSIMLDSGRIAKTICVSGVTILFVAGCVFCTLPAEATALKLCACIAAWIGTALCLVACMPSANDDRPNAVT